MDARMEEYCSFMEAYLRERCFTEDAPQQQLFEAMRYSLLAVGKRLRPVMVFEFCRLCGGDWHKAVPFAAAIEMVHTYSLIHDDLPCMDNDDYRRGRLTNHKVYGEATAVLAGDALLTAAFSRIGHSDFPASQRSEAMTLLADCAGEMGMVGGQMLDMAAETRECTEHEILDIQSRKTGELIRAACELGVIAANGTHEQHKAAAAFADHLGLAFQIRDDVLDRIGDKATLGKSVGTDDNKNTFVRLYGLDKCMDLVRMHTDLAVEALSDFPDNAWLCNLAEALTTRFS